MNGLYEKVENGSFRLINNDGRRVKCDGHEIQISLYKSTWRISFATLAQGTIGVAQQSRFFYGCEADGTYFPVANWRIERDGKGPCPTFEFL